MLVCRYSGYQSTQINPPGLPGLSLPKVLKQMSGSLGGAEPKLNCLEETDLSNDWTRLSPPEPPQPFEPPALHDVTHVHVIPRQHKRKTSETV